MTDEIDLTPEAVVAMMEGVTPGPWRFVPQGAKTSITDEEYDVLFRAAGTCAPYYDARFIAWAREAVPALSASLARFEWQPIETAPRGVFVDLWVFDPLGSGPKGGCRIVECVILPDGSDALGGTGTLIGADECLCFSHWMPLPLPPSPK